MTIGQADCQPFAVSERRVRKPRWSAILARYLVVSWREKARCFQVNGAIMVIEEIPNSVPGSPGVS